MRPKPIEPEFSEILSGVLWVGSHPARTGPLVEVLQALAQRGAGAVISVCEKALEPDSLARAGLAALHLPVENYAAPEPEQLAEAVAFIDAQRAQGRITLVHCFAGIGRAGTVAAAYLVSQGRSAEEAIKEMRRKRSPSCVETVAQADALFAFERSHSRR
jgi:atypical dual specificity phosphatase